MVPMWSKWLWDQTTEVMAWLRMVRPLSPESSSEATSVPRVTTVAAWVIDTVFGGVVLPVGEYAEVEEDVVGVVGD